MPEVPSKSLPRPPKKPLREQSDSRSRERRGGGGALEVVVEGGQKRSHSHGDDLEVRSLRKRIDSNKSKFQMSSQENFLSYLQSVPSGLSL